MSESTCVVELEQLAFILGRRLLKSEMGSAALAFEILSTSLESLSLALVHKYQNN